uniref:Uncharacterized protein n=1 Tax=Spermophilus dauricus TaxID=99837 RepID=A0A8C9P750_SPEDA
MSRSSCTMVVAHSASSLMQLMARAVAPQHPLQMVGPAPVTAAASIWPRYLKVAPTAFSWRRHPLWKA